MSYHLIKNVHILTVVTTFTLFLLRGLWMLLDSPKLQAKWVKIVPHLNDSILLASAITLAVLSGQYPFQAHWLTAKIIGLIAYILLGSVALKRGKTRMARGFAFVAALLTFFYIVLVALTRNAFPL